MRILQKVDRDNHERVPVLIDAFSLEPCSNCFIFAVVFLELVTTIFEVDHFGVHRIDHLSCSRGGYGSPAEQIVTGLSRHASRSAVCSDCANIELLRSRNVLRLREWSGERSEVVPWSVGIEHQVANLDLIVGKEVADEERPGSSHGRTVPRQSASASFPATASRFNGNSTARRLITVYEPPISLHLSLATTMANMQEIGDEAITLQTALLESLDSDGPGRPEAMMAVA